MNSLCIADLELRLATIAHYAELVEAFLKREASALEARVLAGMKEQPSSEQQDYFEAFLGDIITMSQDLPTLLRFSLVVAIDSAIEQTLVGICDGYAKLLGLSLSQHDLRGSTLERARRYMKEVVRIPFPDQAPHWTDLMRLRDLRNAIVHGDGQVGANQGLSSWLARQPGISLKDGHTVVLEASFIDHAISICRGFIPELDGAIGARPLTPFEAGFEALKEGPGEG